MINCKDYLWSSGVWEKRKKKTQIKRRKMKQKVKQKG